MIRERHRREILQRLRTMRRFETIAKSARQQFYEKLREAYKEGATPKELGELIGVSYGRIKQILEESMKEQVHRKRRNK